jgi:hypothetical protein
MFKPAKHKGPLADLIINNHLHQTNHRPHHPVREIIIIKHYILLPLKTFPLYEVVWQWSISFYLWLPTATPPPPPPHFLPTCSFLLEMSIVISNCYVSFNKTSMFNTVNAEARQCTIYSVHPSSVLHDSSLQLPFSYFLAHSTMWQQCKAFSMQIQHTHILFPLIWYSSTDTSK